MYKGSVEECNNFPLSKDVIDPKINLFQPIKCGQLKTFNVDNIGNNLCFRDKTLIVIGDSRGRLLSGHLSVLLYGSFRIER